MEKIHGPATSPMVEEIRGIYIYIWIYRWLVVWNMADIFLFSWEFHDPDEVIFFRGLKPPTRYGLIGLQNLRRFHVVPINSDACSLRWIAVCFALGTILARDSSGSVETTGSTNNYININQPILAMWASHGFIQLLTFTTSQ